MNKKQRVQAISAGTILILVVVIAVIYGNVRTAATVTDIRISYKLERRLHSGVYGGDQWVSPPTYSGQEPVETKALGLDAKGNPIPIRPKWIVSDPNIVTVSPDQGDGVKITIKRAGQSTVQLTIPGVSKELSIKAEDKNNILRFEITQHGAKRTSSEDAAAQAFDSQKEKLSYALGVNLGNGIRKQSVDVDPSLVVQGLNDGLAGSGMRLTEEDVRVVVSALQNEFKFNLIAGVAKKNKEQGEAFLDANKTEEGVITLESGLQYKVIKAGSGRTPTLDDTVVCRYRGTLIDGKEFDSSDKRNEPGSFQLRKVIKGWTEALQLMPVGSKWQLFIPPHLAYGARGTKGGIWPNATLIFEVELISIKDRSGRGRTGHSS